MEFIQLKAKKKPLKQVHYLVKLEKVLPTQKNFHPILVDYGDDQFTLRIQDEDNTVTYTTLDSFSFPYVSPSLNMKKTIKKKTK